MRQQAITWANVDPDLYRHMVWIGYIELNQFQQTITQIRGHEFTGVLEIFLDLGAWCQHWDEGSRYIK